MPESTQMLPIALAAALVGPALLIGSATAPKIAMPAQAVPHAAAEPAEAQLPPVGPVWRRNGWRAVVPHGYVIRALVPARIRPEASAPAAFRLKGGVRVPILEQRARWWRVGWTHGQTGWMPAADLQPHAAFVFIDVRTGRVLRRLAARGEQGSVPASGLLWSFSDTGITRTSLTDPPAMWSNPVRLDPHGSLPKESVWAPDRSAFFVRANTDGTGPLVEVSARTGGVRRETDPGGHNGLLRADAHGRVLIQGFSYLHLYDARRGREIRRAPAGDQAKLAVGKDGAIYAAYARTGSTPLVRYDPNLKPAARAKLVKDPWSICLSADQRVLAVSYWPPGIELRRAGTLATIVTLEPGREVGEPWAGPYVDGLAGGAGGWWTVTSGEGNSGVSVTQYTRRGRQLRTWYFDPPEARAMTPDGRSIYLVRRSDLLMFDTTRGTTRRIPYIWRRPLALQYLPKPSNPNATLHMEVSALTLTPDGRTLILTEWLNGDPEG